ncbi:hypothetical protein H4R34_000938 [Dimargaris verticillata]|uniref:SCP domain-containing protein n=1 Tax=Dimargaris verticillata TaxID=2761393 RepID=A0A9W8EFF6_9FUNG|nr:hypothetical protein H4R34_000938 [Dimargaris verticillata]
MRLFTTGLVLTTLLSGLLAQPFRRNAEQPAKCTRLGTVDPKAVLDLVNVYRESKGVQLLELDGKLNDNAQQQAAYQAAIHAISQDNVRGTLEERLAEQGYQATFAAQNVALGYRTAKGVVEAWIKDTTTESRLANPQACAMGVARVNRYWSLVLACLDKQPQPTSPPSNTESQSSDESLSETDGNLPVSLTPAPMDPAPTTTSKAAATQPPAATTTAADATTTVAKVTPVITPSSTPTESETVPQPTGGFSELQQQVLSLVNEHRQANGANPLKLDARLCADAQRHSDHQQSINDMTHADPNGSLGTRLKAASISYSLVAENIARDYDSPQAVVKGWISSPGHNANILNAKSELMGIAKSGKFWTQNFVATR